MACKNEYEIKYLCNFSLETRIDDIDLPNKIKDKLNSLDLRPDPEKVYTLWVYFSVDIYYEVEFYKFPVEWKPYEIDKLKELEERKKINERTETIRGGVLSQQIHNICNALEPFNINFDSATIAGMDFSDDINRVDFHISEFEKTIQEPTSKNKKKAKQEESKIIPCNIMPNRSQTFNRLVEGIEKIKKAREEEEYTKAQEISQHTPNMKGVEDFFLALATAILEDRPDKLTSPEKLSREMIVQSELVNDWPLEIRGSAHNSLMENCLIHEKQIDCPEFLVYVKSKGYWTLRKTSSLEEAKDTILHYGYNYKNVEQVVVLHNLKNVRFNLFTVNREEIAPISKSEAHTAKKLFLSWCKD